MMKKHFFLYAVSLFALLALTAEATEKDPALEDLQEIARNAFPLACYDANKDTNIEDRERLLTASQHIPADPIIFDIPLDVLWHHIFPYLDSQTLLLGAKRTCHAFYELSHLSCFYLNDYCLTETRPHAIPVHILRFKTCNTKDGLLKLANLMSVSATDLKNWFEPEFLKDAFLPYQTSLPPKLEGQSEEDIGKLYPILKVALASTLVETTDATNPVIKLLQEYPYPYGLSLNKMRLLSLNPARPGMYYESLSQLITGPHAYPRTSPTIKSIARELLMAGKGVAGINNVFFVYPNFGELQNREIAIQILELCVQNPSLYQDYDFSTLIHCAFFLEQPDLALKFLSKTVELPDNAGNLYYKISSFFNCKDRGIKDKEILSCIHEFSKNLYSSWAEIPAYAKFQALSLLMQVEKREEVQKAMDDILSQSEEEVLKAFQAFVLKDLAHYQYPEESRKLTQYLLNVEMKKITPMLLQCNNNEAIFTQFLTIDRQKSIALLKAFIEFDAESDQGEFYMRHKIGALHFLAQHAPEEMDHKKSEVLLKDFLKSDHLSVDSKLDALYFLAQYAAEESDQKESIIQLKALIKSDQTNMETKIGFPLFLAKHCADEEDYIIQQIKSLDYEEREEFAIEKYLSIAYYYLDRLNLCDIYYQEYIQKILSKTDHKTMERCANILKRLQEGGLHIEHVKDLLKYDPFKVIGILMEGRF